MAKADRRIGHESIDAMLSVATLLETPRLTRIYAYVFQHGPATADELRDHLEIAQTTAYQDLNRLVDRGLLVATDPSPREYTAPPVSLTIQTKGDSYTVTPALIAAIARRDEDPDIDVYLDRHGIAGLARALDYAAQYIAGEMNARIMSRRHNLTVVEAETILQALRDVLVAFDDEARKTDDEFSWS
jgi:DNA-binding transcriptional ArsR family regulator